MSCRLLTSCGKGRRASLCIDADDGWVHGNRSSEEGKKKWGVGAVGRHWMSNSLTSPSTALWIFAPLSAHRMRSLLCALSALEMKRQVAKLPCVATWQVGLPFHKRVSCQPVLPNRSRRMSRGLCWLSSTSDTDHNRIYCSQSLSE